MKNKVLFTKSLNTLLFSWGGEPPLEAIWAANDFIKYYESVNNIELPKFDEEDPEISWQYNKITQTIINS